MMAELKGKNKRLALTAISLSSFLNLTDTSRRQSSPQKFPTEIPDGVVGLGILAALSDASHQDPTVIDGSNSTTIVVSTKPIPILSNRDFSMNNSVKKHIGAEEMELCEEYTFVISGEGEHVEADLVGKNEGSQTRNVFDSSEGRGGTFRVADFLSSCFLCQKVLHGLDIFMYRGEKAFCSAECRHQQIATDEKKEKRQRSGMRKPMASSSYSVSPCSGPLQFYAGVAAA